LCFEIGNDGSRKDEDESRIEEVLIVEPDIDNKVAVDKRESNMGCSASVSF